MILYFDTETTGLNPGYICQLSYIMQDPFGDTAKNFFFTVPYVEYGAFMVHGFSVGKLTELSGGKVFADSIEEIAYDFASADLIVAHNVNFDTNFMRTEFERTGTAFRYQKEFDSMKSAVPVCKLPRRSGLGYKYPKLTELCDFLGVDFNAACEEERRLFGAVSKSHDARYDTASMYLCVKKAMEGYPEEFDIKDFV